MRTCDGLSLTEVLVSLAIVTSASLAVIQQQSHVGQFTHQMNHRNEVSLQLDNVAEQFLIQPHLSNQNNSQFTLHYSKQYAVFKTVSDVSDLGPMQRWLVPG